MAAKKRVPPSNDLPDMGSYGESTGSVINELGGPDIVAGHEAMLREHLKQEALQFTRNRAAIRRQDEFNRGNTKTQRMT